MKIWTKPAVREQEVGQEFRRRGDDVVPACRNRPHLTRRDDLAGSAGQ